MPQPCDSLRALLTGVVDYAGLFPPAALALDASIRNYARYLDDADRWMLGRFICPAGRLGELVPYVEELFSTHRLTVSALAAVGADQDAFRPALSQDITAVERFREAAGGRATVDVLETRLPSEAGTAVLAELAGVCREAGLRPFVEAGFAGDWRVRLARTLETIAGQEGLGYKLRSGGVEASAFPTPEQVAFAIAVCARAGIPMKFTAGLHHPVRRYHQSVQTKMHGFLNVFTACCLGWGMKWDERRLLAVLEDEDPRSFRFQDYGLSWRDAALSTEQVAQARRDFATSFGSCSFDEPREDLRGLGLM